MIDPSSNPHWKHRLARIALWLGETAMGQNAAKQRPKDPEQQTAHDSAKKKAHTDKVVYLSPTVGGQTHDKQLADARASAFPPGATLGKGPPEELFCGRCWFHKHWVCLSLRQRNVF